jgi:hypothetical protein
MLAEQVRLFDSAPDHWQFLPSAWNQCHDLLGGERGSEYLSCLLVPILQLAIHKSLNLGISGKDRAAWFGQSRQVHG